MDLCWGWGGRELCKSTGRGEKSFSRGFVLIGSKLERGRGAGGAVRGSGALRRGSGRCVVALRDVTDGEIKSVALPFLAPGEIGIYRVADTGAGQRGTA